MNDKNDNTDQSKSNVLSILYILIILIALLINYLIILKVEIIDEIKNGSTTMDALMTGNIPLTILGVSISVFGTALIIYLICGKKSK